MDGYPRLALPVIYRWLLFAMLFAAIVIPAFSGIANPITSFLSVWAIALLALSGFVVESDAEQVSYLQNYGWVVAIVFWTLIGLLYSWLTKRMRTFHFVLLTYPVIFAVLYVTAFVLYLFGVEHAPW